MTRRSFIGSVASAAILSGPAFANGKKPFSAKFVKGCDLAAFRPPEGCDLVLVDVQDAMKYPSHPEIATANSMEPGRMSALVADLRAKGVRAIPMLEFSTARDAWLGVYDRMVGSSVYRKLLPDLIGDAYRIFGKPEFVHIGFSREDWQATNTNGQQVVLMRIGNLWMRWFKFTAECVRAVGAHPWAWFDYQWPVKDFLDEAPKDIVLSNFRKLSAQQESESRSKMTIGDCMKQLSDRGFTLVPRLSSGETFAGADVIGTIWD